MKHKKSDRSTQIFSVYYGRSLECHTGSVDVSGSSPLCSTKKSRQTSRVWRFSFRLKLPNIYPASVSPAPILTEVCEFFFGCFAHELGVGYVEFYI